MITGDEKGSITSNQNTKIRVRNEKREESPANQKFNNKPFADKINNASRFMDRENSYSEALSGKEVYCHRCRV